MNPTPRFTVSVPDTIVCDSTEITLDVVDGLGAVEGAKVYELTTTQSGGITGIEPDNEYGIDHDITDQLINTTNQVQTVTYHLSYQIRDDRSGTNFGYCDHGIDTSITIYVNPTPRFTVSVPDTIVCDSTEITLDVVDGLGGVEGAKVYELTTTTSGGITGIEPDNEYGIDHDITDQLINTTNQVQTVTYHLSYQIRDDRSGTNFGYCDHGIDTSITIYVNPTPRFTVSVPDTIVCDSTEITLDVVDGLGAVEGAKVYELTTTQSGGITGIEPDNEYGIDHDITDQLINTTNQVQTVTYHLSYQIRDDRSGTNFGYCDHGIDTYHDLCEPHTEIYSQRPRYDRLRLDGDHTGCGRRIGRGRRSKVYELTTSQSGGINGIEPDNEYGIDHDITDQLINTTNQVQTVTYHLSYQIRDDRSGTNFGYCDHGIDTSITIYVNPTPRFTVSVPDTIVCDSTEITLDVVDGLGAVEGAKVYELTTSQSGGITGIEPDNEYGIDHDITDQLINTTNQVQTVTYHLSYQIRDDRSGTNFGYCDHGIDTSITIYVNPTPRFTVSVPDTIVCDSTEITLDVVDGLGAVEGAKVYELTTSQSGGITGIEPDNEYGIDHDITDQLINTTNQVQTVTYHLSYQIRDDRSGTNFGYCDHGIDTSITIYVNPTPRFTVSVPDTIVCDSTEITLDVVDGLGGVEGAKVYELTTTQSGGITGIEPDNEYGIDHDITDQLINTTNQVQTVTYHLSYQIRDDRSGTNFGYCDHGIDTSITIYVNPTPRFTVSVPDTIVCDSTEITLDVVDGLGGVEGAKVYELTTSQSGGITGIEPDNEYGIDHDITDQLINTTSQVQTVTYHLSYQIRDDRSGTNFGYCDHGIDTSITIYVNPTPRFTVSVPDTIVCDSTEITLDVVDGLGAVEGAKVYELTTSQSGGITGIEPDNEYGIDHDITDQLINTTNQVQTVTYHLSYQIRDDRSGTNFGYCDHGIDTSITIYVNPTPRFTVSVPDTIVCDSTEITLDVVDGLGGVEGAKVYELSTTTSGGIDGIQPGGEYANRFRHYRSTDQYDKPGSNGNLSPVLPDPR